MNELFLYAGALGAGTVATLLLTPFFRMVARRFGIMDRPKSAEHKLHGHATALLGGAALFLGYCLVLGGGFALLLLIPSIRQHLPVFREALVSLQTAGPKLGFLLLGAGMATVLGLIDDIWALKAGPKFLGQFAVAVVAVVWGGARISVFFEAQTFTLLMSIFWIMFMMNAINFFDNMDGLAAGTVAIAMGYFALIAIFNGQYLVGCMAAAGCGVCAGFWVFNHAPATIFMGDSGSHFVGYMAAITAGLVTYFRFDSSISRFPVLVPLMILAIPVFDAAAVVVIRTRNRKPFWIGDHNHISHRFLHMGLSRPDSVRCVHLLSLAAGALSVPVMWGNFLSAAFALFALLITLGLVTFLQIKLKKTPVEASHGSTL
ncbi:MAG: MraY family glycosyltransferase [Victivallaceae bacterium]|nr:MraY family glycosyltransferase [Victivallaceae bacterium]